jgi:hypothetical protein
MDLVTGFMAFLATILIAHAVYDQFHDRYGKRRNLSGNWQVVTTYI